MRTQFTILLGPVDSIELGKTLTRVTRAAPLLEVKQMTTNQTLKPKSQSKIIRKPVTPEGKKEMQFLRDGGKKVWDIAKATGYSEITVKRHTVDEYGKQTL